MMATLTFRPASAVQRALRGLVQSLALNSALCLFLASEVKADDFETPWLVMPFGGDRGSYNEGFVVSGAAGDPAASATMSGGDFSLTGGAWASFNHVSPPCGGDLTGDARVDLNDLSVVLINYGVEGLPPWDGDLNGDGLVSLGDINIVLVNYGNFCN